MSDNENDDEKEQGEDIAGDIHIGRSVSSGEHIFTESDDSGEISNVDFSVEFETIFSHIADRLYGSDEAAIREGLTNSVTSILRARSRGLISESEGTIEFEIHDGGPDSSGTLILRDNGIGMSREEIEKVVAKVGATTSKTDGNLAGQFGMGFLALFKLVGLDNAAFIMYSNSRLNNNPPISGSWNSKGFSPAPDGKLAGSFTEDDKGVKFYFPLKDDISAQDIISYVRDNASFSRVPVLLKYYNENNELIIDDELGGDNVLDQVDDTEPFVEYEDEYIHAICSPSCPNRTILLDVPVDRGFVDRRLSLPFSKLMVRLKNEKGVVVSGPNEGNMRVSDIEYSSLEAEGLNNEFITDGSIERGDIVMPRPKTNRDGLERNREFWEWVSERVNTAYNDKLEEIGQSINSIGDMLSLDEVSLQLFTSQIPEMDESLEDFSLEDYLERWDENNVRGSFSDDLIEKIALTTATVGEATLDNVMMCNKASGRDDRKLYEVLREVHNNGELYIGVSMNPSRVKVVLEDSEYNRAISVDNTQWYDLLQNNFDAKLLNNVTKERLDEFDIGEDTVEFFSEYTASSSKDMNMRQKSIKLHFGEKSNLKETKSEKLSFGDFEEKLNDNSDNSLSFFSKTPDQIVVFTRTCGHRLSDYKFKTASLKTPVVSLTKAQLETVKNHPKIITAPEFMEKSKSTVVKTSEGEIEMREVVEEFKPVFHILPDTTVELFRENSILNSMNSICRSSNFWADFYYYSDDNDNCALTDSKALYVPITFSEYRTISMVIQQDNSTVLSTETLYNGETEAGNSVKSIPADSAFYIDAVNRIHENETMTFLSTLLHQNNTQLEKNKEEILALKSRLIEN